MCVIKKYRSCRNQSLLQNLVMINDENHHHSHHNHYHYLKEWCRMMRKLHSAVHWGAATSGARPGANRSQATSDTCTAAAPSAPSAPWRNPKAPKKPRGCWQFVSTWPVSLLRFSSDWVVKETIWNQNWHPHSFTVRGLEFSLGRKRKEQLWKT